MGRKSKQNQYPTSSSGLPTGHVCIYRDPRPSARRYSAKDVARITCLAMSQGVTWSEIQREIQDKCKMQATECDCEKVHSYLPRVLEALAAAVAIIALVRVAGPLVANLVRAIPAAWWVWKELKALPKQDIQQAAKELENLADKGRTFEGEFERLADEGLDMLKEMARVEIRP